MWYPRRLKRIEKELESGLGNNGESTEILNIFQSRLLNKKSRKKSSRTLSLYKPYYLGYILLNKKTIAHIIWGHMSAARYHTYAMIKVRHHVEFRPFLCHTL